MTAPNDRWNDRKRPTVDEENTTGSIEILRRRIAEQAEMIRQLQARVRWLESERRSGGIQ